MEQELIKTFKKDDGSIAVDGRDLHDFLGVETPYTMWINRMMGYGFAENVDFSVFNKNVNDDTAFGGTRKMKDHALTLDMAKELSMIQRTPKGKQARQYFINVEKKYNSLELPKTFPQALRQLADQVEIANKQREELNEKRPKADYYDEQMNNPALMSITPIAKEFGLTAQAMNKVLKEHKIIFKRGKSWYLNKEYADKGYGKNQPYTVNEEFVINALKWTQRGKKFIEESLTALGYAMIPVTNEIEGTVNE